MLIRDRYHNDPMFKILVDMLYFHIEQAKFTPTEIREAAMLAQIIYEERHLKSHIILDKLNEIDSIRSR